MIHRIGGQCISRGYPPEGINKKTIGLKNVSCAFESYSFSQK